ncbi:MAG: AMP-binding protein [Chlamydiales bacterium]
MKSFLILCLTWLARLTIRIRYRICCKNLDSLIKNYSDKKGILFLPNHPAEIDSVILMSRIWPYFKPKPLVVEHFFYQKNLNPFMKLVNAIPIPNFENSANSWKIKKGEMAVNQVIQELKEGKNFLIYPTGHLKRNGRDVVGGSSIVHRLLQEVPETKVVLIRISGLWGSSFSKALTGKVPHFWDGVFNQIKTILKNGIFFVPKRQIDIEFLASPENFPYNKSKIELNDYMEHWFNQYIDEQGNKVDREPLRLVSFSRWKTELPEVEYQEQLQLRQKGVLHISEEERLKVYEQISELSNIPVTDIQENMDLSKDLGLDSLDAATLYAFLDQSYKINLVDLSALKTVYDVLELIGADRPAPEPIQEQVELKPWPKEGKRPRVLIPDGQTIQEVFLVSVERLKDFMACSDQRRDAMSYKEFKKLALILATRFSAYPGKYIGILLPACISVYIVVFALLLVGKIPVMLNWTAGVRTLNFATLLLDLDVVISSRQFLDQVQTLTLGSIDEKLVLLEDVKDSLKWSEKLKGLYLSTLKPQSLHKKLKLDTIKADDTALILFTSGTETLPKAVPLSHKNILSNQRAGMDFLDLRSDDILFGVLPPFHSFGFSLAGIMPILAGIRVYYSPDPNDSRRMGYEMETKETTLVCMAPSFYKNLFKVATKEQLKSVRWFISGAEKATDDLFEYVKRLGKNKRIVEGYGITECSPMVTVCHPDRPPVGVGQPLNNIEICSIHPETHELLPKGEMGEICIHGPNVFAGYLGKKPIDSFVQLNNKIWYRSGDMGYLNEDGYLILGGRLKRFIKIGGEMISLEAVEQELKKVAKQKHWVSSVDDKANLALIGFEKYEGKPYLVLFTTFTVNRDEINTVIRDSGFGRIVKIAEVQKLAEIPLTGTGKVHYRVLEEKLLDKS